MPQRPQSATGTQEGLQLLGCGFPRQTGRRKHNHCMAFPSTISPSSRNVEQQTFPCCLQSTLTSHPTLLVHCIRRLRSLLPASHPSHHVLAQKTRYPGTFWVLQAGPCRPTVPTALLHPLWDLGLPPWGQVTPPSATTASCAQW